MGVQVEAHAVTDTVRLVLRHRGSMQKLVFISIFVQPCHKIPAASSLMGLLNLSDLFVAEGRPLGEKIEIDIMAALSLISARKFIQGIEKLRKIQGVLLLN